MALKFTCQSKDEISEEHLPFYAQREGAWQLDVDGVADKAKLDEFRKNNVSLKKHKRVSPGNQEYVMNPPPSVLRVWGR